MNALDVAQAFLTYAQAQEALAGWDLRLGQDSDEITKDMVIFDAQDEPLTGSANVSTIHLSILVETHAQDSTEAQHAVRVKTVREVFFGDDPSAERAFRSAVVTVINAAQAVVSVYGYGATPSIPGHDQNRFRTPINIALLARYV